MENLGSLAILLAFCVAIYAAAASVVGRIKRKPFLIVSGGRAVYSVWLLVALASGILVYTPADQRFPLLLRRGAQQPHHAHPL